MYSRCSWIPVLLALFCGRAAAQVISDMPMAEVLARVQTEQMQPFVDYCVGAVPDLKQDFGRAFDLFTESLDVVSDELVELAEDAGQREVPREEFEASMRLLKDTMDSALEEMKQLPPEPVCSSILARLQSASVNELRELMRASLIDYEARSRELSSLDEK